MLLLCGVLLVGGVQERAEVFAFTESLARLRGEFHSVEIDFTLTAKDAVFRRARESSGRFRMLRESDGTLYGSLSLVPANDPEKSKVSYVLRGEELSAWDAATRTVTRFTRSKKDGAFRYVAENWYGAVCLLDRVEAAKRCEIRVFKRDANYLYLDMAVKEDETRSGTRRYRLAVMVRDVDGFPRYAVREIFVAETSGDTKYIKITRWAVDRPEAKEMRAKDFPDPANPLEGWTVSEGNAGRLMEELRKIREAKKSPAKK